MRKPPRPSPAQKTPDFADLPVLTEITESSMHLPVLTEMTESSAHMPMLAEALTEAVSEAAPAPETAAPLSDAQCARLAEQLAPKLDALLREKLNLRIAAAWLDAWAEVKAELPDLIRAELEQSARRSRN